MFIRFILVVIVHVDVVLTPNSNLGGLVDDLRLYLSGRKKTKLFQLYSVCCVFADLQGM